MSTVRARWERLPGLGNLGWPIAEKELRALIRRQRFFWLQFFYLLVLATGFCVFVAGAQHGSMPPELIGQRLFTIFFTAQTALAYLIFPAFAAIAIAGERAEKSFDLLMTTDLRPYEVVWGKFLGIVGNSAYFMLVSVPLLGACILFGGLSLRDAVENYLLLMTHIVLITIFGLFISAASPSSVRAIIVTYLVAGLVGLGSTVGLTKILGAGAERQSVLSFFLSTLPAGLELWGIATAGLVLCLAFVSCFLGAVHWLGNAEERATLGFRVLIAIAIAGGLGSLLWLRSALVGQAPFPDTWSEVRFVSRISIPIGLLAIGILPLVAADRVATPRRTAALGRRRPVLAHLGWLLLPGGMRGLLFSWLALVALFGGLWLEARAISGLDVLQTPKSFVFSSMPEHLAACWGLCAVAIAAYCAAGFLLSSWRLQGGATAGFLFAAAVIVNLYPVVFLIADQEARFWHLRPGSVVLTLNALADFRDYGLRSAVHSQWLISMVGHAVVAILCTTLGCITLRRRGVPALALQIPRSPPPHTPASASVLVRASCMALFLVVACGCAVPRLVRIPPAQMAAERTREGIAHETLGQIALAQRSYRAALAWQDDHPTAWRGLVRTASSSQRAELQDELQAWEARVPQLSLPALLSGMLEGGEERAGAWRRAWQRAPVDDSVLLRPAELNLTSLAEWRAHATLLETLEPRTPELEFRSAWLAQRLGSDPAVLSARRPADAVLLSAARAFARGDRHAALVQLSAAGDRPQAALLEARACLQDEAPGRALAALARLATSSEEAAGKRLIEAEIALASGASGRALSLLRALHAAPPALELTGNLDPSDRVAAALALNRHPGASEAEARSALACAIPWAPTLADLERLAGSLIRRGATAELALVLTRMFEAAPASHPARTSWQRAHQFLAQFALTVGVDGREDLLGELLRRHGGWVVGLASPGEARAALGSLPVAERARVLATWFVHPAAELRLVALVEVRERHPELWAAAPTSLAADPDARVRAGWIALAGRQGGGIARSAVEQGRADPDPYVREVAERTARALD